VPWPSDVLEDYAPVAAEVLGSSSSSAAGAAGRGRGRGPVLRMGLAEGNPHSILPDHLVSSASTWHPANSCASTLCVLEHQRDRH
jgi:hypothetical protein